MATWDHQHYASELPTTPTPELKYEPSPAESFLSVPGELYPSLFAAGSPMSATMDPSDTVMTPDSSEAADDAAANASSPGPDATPAATPAADGEKKPVKKRKSWGQVLPEPKTNLPPRKRAKTEDEKEQRRVERVLRNRRAAQSSRERKRQEVEALEQRNAALESALHNQQKQNLALMEELAKLRRSSSVISQSPSALDVFQPSPLTLSQPLFQQSTNPAGMMDDFILMPEQDGTVDPASISPELAPTSDSDLKTGESDPVSSRPAPATASSDATQHPAAVLCDLQCPSVEAPPAWWPRTQTSPSWLLPTWLMASSVLISACSHPLTLITGALKTNLVLHPTPSILSTIIWMVTLPPNFRTLTSVSSSAATTTSAAPSNRPARRRHTTRSPKTPTPPSASSTLRIKSLQKLLTSSPILARPLMDATMGFLRLVSEGCDDRVDELAVGASGVDGDESRGPLLWPDGTSLPSREVLLTLLWAIRVEERKRALSLSQEITETPDISSSSASACSRPGSSILRKKTSTTTPDQTTVLSAAAKRKGDGAVNKSGGKRIRLGL
ncbi:hypothetical protein F5Y14DRAFT_424638 [Nemania sp. NC0429]|nr:hypothetical protein F5Y14DRAFT_424638 [Nemania sp. NC0429]